MTYPSPHTTWKNSLDGYHLLVVQGRPLSGNTWYECEKCDRKLERELDEEENKNGWKYDELCS